MGSSTFAEMFPGILACVIGGLGYLLALYSRHVFLKARRVEIEQREASERPAE